jgi:hypothetical protein
MIAPTAWAFVFGMFVVSSLVLVPMTAGRRKNPAKPSGAPEALRIGQSQNGTSSAPQGLSGALSPLPGPFAPRAEVAP